MKYRFFKDFIQYSVDKENACYYYKMYPKRIQNILENVYNACYRFGLHSCQTLYMLNKVLEPFDNMKTLENELLDL